MVVTLQCKVACGAWYTFYLLLWFIDQLANIFIGAGLITLHQSALTVTGWDIPRLLCILGCDHGERGERGEKRLRPSHPAVQSPRQGQTEGSMQRRVPPPAGLREKGKLHECAWCLPSLEKTWLGWLVFPGRQLPPWRDTLLALVQSECRVGRVGTLIQKGQVELFLGLFQPLETPDFPPGQSQTAVSETIQGWEHDGQVLGENCYCTIYGAGAKWMLALLWNFHTGIPLWDPFLPLCFIKMILNCTYHFFQFPFFSSSG